MGEVSVSSADHCHELLEGLWNCLVEQYKVDAEIRCQGHAVKAHQLLLRAGCPSVREMTDATHLDLDHLTLDGQDVGVLLEFVYRGKTSIPEDRLDRVRSAAEALGLRHLVAAIQQHSDAEQAARPASSRSKRKGTPFKIAQAAYELREGVSGNETMEEQQQQQQPPAPTTPRKTRTARVAAKRRFTRQSVKGEAETTKKRTTEGATEGEEGPAEDDVKEEAAPEDEGGSSGGDVVEAVLETVDPRNERPETEPEVMAAVAVRKPNRAEYNRLRYRNRAPLKCPHCPYETKDKDNYRSHVAKHDPNAERYQCDLCGKKFRNKRGFTYHVRAHVSPDQMHKCLRCDFSTPQKGYWIKHMAVKHRIDAHGNELTDEFRCDQCEFASVLESRVKEHVTRAHVGLKPFKCAECEYASFRKGDLDKHVSIRHRHERPYMCEACGFRSQTSGGIERHKRTHTGEKPYKCATCGQAYADIQKLKSHLKRHTNDEKPYVCHLCGHAFRRRDNLQMHVKRIHKVATDDGGVATVVVDEGIHHADAVVEVDEATVTIVDVCSQTKGGDDPDAVAALAAADVECVVSEAEELVAAEDGELADEQDDAIAIIIPGSVTYPIAYMQYQFK